MNWADKEQAYADLYEQGRQAKDLWKYIPQKVREGVVDAFSDSDGYWIWLDHEYGGWTAYDHAEDCGTIHEFNIKDLKNAIKTIRKESWHGTESNQQNSRNRQNHYGTGI